MRLMLFEWLVGGGMLAEPGGLDPGSSLFHEGLGMLEPLARGWLAAGHSVECPVDPRAVDFLKIPGLIQLPVRIDQPLASQLLELAQRNDHFLLIAPETGGCLQRAHDWLLPFRHRSLGPTGAAVTLGSSKSATLQCLEQAGVQLPCHLPFSASFSSASPDDPPDESDASLSRRAVPAACHFTCDHPGPMILKPDDGAGSEHVFRVEHPDALRDWAPPSNQKYRLERFLPGSSISLSVIGGPHGYCLLPPVLQRFTCDEPPEESREAPVPTSGLPQPVPQPMPQPIPWPGPWIGFDAPIDAGLQARAQRLVRAALAALPSFHGWAGFDLILAPKDPLQDRIVDFNPRMTSSLAGLNTLLDQNLPQRMVEMVLGKTVCPQLEPAPRWSVRNPPENPGDMSPAPSGFSFRIA